MLFSLNMLNEYTNKHTKSGNNYITIKTFKRICIELIITAIYLIRIYVINVYCVTQIR